MPNKLKKTGDKNSGKTNILKHNIIDFTSNEDKVLKNFINFIDFSADFYLTIKSIRSDIARFSKLNKEK